MQTSNRKWLRSPSERVGTLSHADLPPPSVSSPHDDAMLVRALRERDEEAFASLLDRWYSPMIRLARTFVRGEAESEEVVQDTWVAVLAGIDRFEGRSSLKTWVFHILVNRALSGWASSPGMAASRTETTRCGASRRRKSASGSSRRSAGFRPGSSR